MNEIYVIEYSEQDYVELRFENSPALIYYVNKIPSAEYNEKERCWKVSKEQSLYIKEFCEFVVKRGLAKEIIELDDSKDVRGMADNMPELNVSYQHLKISPYDYQLKGIRYMLEHKRCFNGDDMGLGKTAQAIATVSIAKAYPCLVVCPAAMKVTWQREFKKFIGKNAIILDNSNKNSWQRNFEIGTCNVFITNYESLKKYFVSGVRGQRLSTKNIILDKRVAMFRAVIIDESHRCKNSSTHWSKYLEAICAGKEYVFLLTGTPIVINNEDLIQQLKIMGRIDDFGGVKKFKERYCSGPHKSSNLNELNYRLWKTCYFRREKSLVLKDLPEKTRQYLVVDIANRKEYDLAEKNLLEYLRQYEQATDETIKKASKASGIVQVNVLRQIAAKGKLSEAKKFINDVIGGGNKLIVFAFHKNIVEEIVKTFPGTVTVTGNDSPEEKQLSIDSFQNGEDCKLIALNYKSGGVGITLTAASRTLFIEFPWTASDCEQSECRCHRNGQKNNVNCYYLLARETIDEVLLDVIEKERTNSGVVTGAVNDVEERIIEHALEYYKINNKWQQ